MSRLPRAQEHLKAGFTAEAVSAARFRAYAARADEEGLPNLAAWWRELAAAKDELAILQLRAAGQVRDAKENVLDALAEERFENEVLYPKVAAEVGEDTVRVFEEVVRQQAGHLARLEELRERLNASGSGDLS